MAVYRRRTRRAPSAGAGNIQITVENFVGFERLSKALKQAGNEGKGLRKELLKTINAETKPLKAAAKANARATLPRRGGLARLVASSKFTTKTRTTGRGAGVRIIATRNSRAQNLRRIDRGTVRHPLFGNEESWHTQSVKPGWFSEPMKKGVGKVREAVKAAVDRVIASIR